MRFSAPRRTILLVSGDVKFIRILQGITLARALSEAPPWVFDWHQNRLPKFHFTVARRVRPMV